MLEGISLSQPQPKIPSELIRFLGKTYSAWHIAIPLLESHVMLFPQVSVLVMLLWISMHQSIPSTDNNVLLSASMLLACSVSY